MAPSLAARLARSPADRVRDRLLTQLHLGQLVPGDRVASVRTFADQAGVNRKTVHRAFRQLAREGLLETRPGAGTFVADPKLAAGARQSQRDLLRAVNRCRAEALTLGMSPAAFVGFLRNYLSEGLRGLPIAVVECNSEQIGLIARQLGRALGIAPQEVRLDALVRDPASTLTGVFGIVTTACHSSEVALATRGLELPLYPMSLDAAFPQRIIERLRLGHVVMVVRDEAFGRVFRRLLGRTGATEADLERLRVVSAEAARAAVREAGPGTLVVASPLLSRAEKAAIPAGVEVLDGAWTLPRNAVEALRAAMACDVAIQRRGPA